MSAMTTGARAPPHIALPALPPHPIGAALPSAGIRRGRRRICLRAVQQRHAPGPRTGSGAGRAGREGGQGPCGSLQQVWGRTLGVRGQGPGGGCFLPFFTAASCLTSSPPHTAAHCPPPLPHLDHTWIPSLQTPTKRDYAEVRKALEGILDVEGYDDGSYGPLLVRQG